MITFSKSSTVKTGHIYKLLPLSDIWDEMIMFYFFYLLYLNILYTGQLHSLSIFLAKFHMFGILVSRIPNLSPPSPTLYRPGVAGAVLQTPPPLINWLSESSFSSRSSNVITPKPLELESWSFERMFILHHVSCVPCHMSPVTYYMCCITCHLSGVTCHLSHVTCHMSCFQFCFVFYSEKIPHTGDIECLERCGW